MISLTEKHLIFQQPPSARLILSFTKNLILLQWKGQYLLPKQTLHKKMKFSIKDFFSKCDEIRSFLRIWSHLLKKSFMEIFIFCAMRYVYMQAHEGTAISATLHSPKVWAKYFECVYSILKRKYLENFIHQLNNLQQSINL